MAVLLDASAILAAADTADLNHAAARAWFARVDEPLLIGALTLAEADHVLQRELGLPATLALLASIASGARAGGARPPKPTSRARPRCWRPPPSTGRGCPTPSSSSRPGASACAGWRPSTAGRSRCWCRAGPRGERLIDLEP